ncbi:MAG: ABC1 kinase family protein [Candidatus Hydrogenedentota bacterium]
MLDKTRNARRLFGVVQVLVRHGFADFVQRSNLHRSLPARLLRRIRMREAPPDASGTFGQRLRAALTELGPTFIKLGQVLSTRPDLVTPPVANELAKLQDAVSPVPFEQIAPVIKDAFGKPVADLFAEFDEEAVASASLSQVYRARLHTGEEVAVKVQRPGIQKVIDADLGLMLQIAHWVDEHVKDMQWLDPPGVVHEFSRSIRRELDFNIEAGIIDRFHENFEDVEDVFIPGTFPALCNTRVLTMEWVDGVRVDRFDAYEARRCDRKLLATRGCEILCDMFFAHRLFHADPHPGNVFITYDNTIAFLDYGMVGHLEKTDVAALADLFLAIFHEDSVETANALLLLTAGGEPENMEGLRHEVADFIAFEARSVVGGGEVARGLERATEIVRHYQLDLAPRFSLLLKALASIEHVGQQLDPEMDMVPVLRPYIEELVSERYTPVELLKEFQHNAGIIRRLARQLPEDVSSISQRLRKGRFRMNLHHEHLEDLVNTLDVTANRISVSVITGALIMGSSWLLAAQEALWGLAIMGFIGAGVMGVSLVVSIVWSRRL